MAGSEGGRVYSRGQLSHIRREFEASNRAECPECHVAMSEERIHPHAGLPYVRRRLWLLCPSCGRSALLETRRER